MQLFYQALEWAVTFIEGAIVLFAASSMSQKKYSAKKHTVFILLAAMIYTGLITLLNTWQTFSFITIGIAVLYTFLTVTVLSSGNFLLRAVSIMISWFFMFSIDYLLTYSIILIIGKSTDISSGFSLLLVPSVHRAVFLTVDKLLQIILFSSCRKLYSKLRLLNKKNLGILLIISLSAFIVMQILTALIITDSLFIIQIAVILSIFFIALSLIATIFSIAVSARYQNEKRTLEIMKITSQMTEKNYKEIHHSNEIIRQQVHDFKNHLRTIDGMVQPGSKAKEYTQNLLADSYSYAMMCHCGNDIIDSIINCKSAEAKTKHIRFEYHIELPDILLIDPIDICAVLANQIDNAMEACEKIDETNKRRLTVHIEKKEAFVLFQVTNSVGSNPLNKKNELLTTKNNENGLHGLGTKIIRETAEKYNGTVNNSYSDGYFTSAAMFVEPNNT